MKFKEGDIVMVVDPTLNWRKRYYNSIYGINGVVVEICEYIYVQHVYVEHGYHDTSSFIYHQEALEKLPAMNTDD